MKTLVRSSLTAVLLIVASLPLANTTTPAQAQKRSFETLPIYADGPVPWPPCCRIGVTMLPLNTGLNG